MRDTCQQILLPTKEVHVIYLFQQAFQGRNVKRTKDTNQRYKKTLIKYTTNPFLQYSSTTQSVTQFGTFFSRLISHFLTVAPKL